mgnify:CR=1 FL=1
MMFKNVNGVDIQLTAQEEADRIAESNAGIALKPMQAWEEDMKATDSTIPRWFEDYVTENSVTLAPGRAKDSYDAKVALRGEKP